MKINNLYHKSENFSMKKKNIETMTFTKLNALK